MAKNFYYSFNVGFQTNSIKIEVDDVVFEIKYIDSNDVEPEIIPISDGYKVKFRNIYSGIDVEFVLKSESIKEFIYVKNKYAIKEFKASLKLENGSISYDKKGKQYDICNKSGNIVFSLPRSYVVDRGGREDKTLKDFAKVLYDFRKKEFTYTFNHSEVKRYPVVVDPSFVFNTRVKDYSGLTYGILDSENIMIVSGSNTYEDLMDDIEILTEGPSGEINVLSDDVLFEDDIVLIFPYAMSSNANVTLKRGREETTFESSSVQYVAGKKINGVDITYTVVNANVSFRSPGSFDVVCTFLSPELIGTAQDGLPSQGYFYAPPRGYGVSYKRKLTYMPKIYISFPNSIDCVGFGSNGILNIDNLIVRNNSSFKPLKYSIIPYDFALIPGTEDYETLATTATFSESPEEVIRTSYKYLTSLFDLSYSTVPSPILTQHTASSFLGVHGGLAPIDFIEKGNLKSFSNNLSIVLRSAVNSRNNMQQEIEFSKFYFAISEEDYEIKKINSTSRALKNVPLRLFAKSFMSFILSQGTTFSDYFDYCESLDPPTDCRLEIKEGSDGNTTIEFLDQVYGYGAGYGEVLDYFDILTQDLDGTYPVDGIDSVTFSSLNENILADCSLCVDVSGEVSTHKIISNTDKLVKIKGRHRSSIMDSRSFCVLLFDPNEIYFKNLSTDKRIKMVKSSINGDGTVSYRDVIYDTDLNSGDDVASLYEARKGFTLVKDINLFGLGSLSA